MSDSRTKRERFLPFAHDRHGLRTKIHGLELDGRFVPEAVDLDSHVLDLRSAWSRARVVLEVTMAPELLEQVLPEDERDEPPLTVLVSVRCGETRLRRGVRAELSVEAPVLVAVDVEHSEILGAAELIPFLVRTKDAAAATVGFARKRGSRVAGGRAWTLRTDLERAPAGRYLELQFKSFSEDPLIPLAERGAVWRLEVMAEDPILWLNQDHTAIANLLRYDGSQGRRARARDVIFDRISASVWTRLFLLAADNVLQDEGEADGWEQSVLDYMLPDLYPGVPTKAARLERLRKDHEDLHLLLGKLDAVLQVRDNGIANLVRLAEDA